MPGVYISYPFCSQKCTYCNFASGVFPAELEARYVDTLAQELRGTAWPWQPETVYLGGGTPSSLAPKDLARLLALVPGRPWREATIEAAPGFLSAANVAAWAECGLTRASLGAQSFVEVELRRTGRKHTAAMVEHDVALLRAAGIESINIDLIAGLPGQTPGGWEQSLDWLERLAVPHVSVYMLEVDGDSRLGAELLRGGARYGASDVPGEDVIVACYERAVERLAQMGLRRYEISNFSRPGCESLHNLKYWRMEPYLGFGADAHSFDGQFRWSNVEAATEYAESPNPRLESERADIASERLYLGLRLSDGVQLSPAEWALHRDSIDRFISDGLLQSDGGILRLTSRGVLLSNEVFMEFLPTCPSL